MDRDTINVFLTGSTGFVGAHVLQGLLNKGLYKVAILIRPGSDTWRIKELLNDVTVISGTLQDIKSYKNEVVEFLPNIVINLAWSGVEGSQRNEHKQLSNIIDMLNLIEICSSCGSELFLGFGSQAEYGPSGKMTSEISETVPTTLYGAAKLASFHNGRVYSLLNRMRFIWGRIYDPYGPMDNNCWLIPSLINKCLDCDSIEVTKAEQIWDFIYIDDLVDAVISLIETPSISGAYNIGYGSGIKLKTVIQYIVDMCNMGNSINFGSVAYRSDQVMHLEANIDRITRDTGWTPTTKIYKGLNKTIEWYLKENNKINSERIKL
jgi:nucleoside-diphosphate-sugar epimerase